MGDVLRTVNVILAAGFGTRMKSAMPKVLHPVLGKSLVAWAVETAHAVSQLPPVVVVGHGRELVQAALEGQADFVTQEQLLGTGHALMQAADRLRGTSDAVMVTYADMPLLQVETLTALAARLEAERAHDPRVALAMLTVTREDAQGFGRILRDVDGGVVRIVEEADCSPEQLLIRELNPGIYCFEAQWLWENLPRIPISRKGEYYLTDMVEIAISQGRRVVTVAAPEEEVTGINTRVHLAEATAVMRLRILTRHMLAGVTLVDPATTTIEAGVQIGRDTTILPGVLLQGDTVVGEGSVVGPYSQVVNSRIGRQCRISFSVVEGALLEDRCEIGPFGHLRKGAHLAEGVHMGNFGEVKNSYLGPGSKMGHFSYMGDAQVGAGVNIGAGTITCNYDGVRKYNTIIGDHVFLGSDTLLVAPVEIGARAHTGAGAVVTHDVPDDTLVYGIPARPARNTGQQDAPDSAA